MSCCGLATLTTVNPPAGTNAGAADALVGAFDGLDRQRRLVFHRHALANVQPAHLLGQLPAEADVLPLPGRWSAAGQLALAHQKFGGVVGRPAETHALAGELLHDRSQERVVFVVFFVREKVRKEHADGPQVGRVPHDHPRLEEQHLVDLAGHDHVGHGMPLEVTDSGAETAQAAPLKILADLGQLGVGVTDDTQAEDLRTLPPQGLDDQEWITSPAGHQANRAGALRGAVETERAEIEC